MTSSPLEITALIAALAALVIMTIAVPWAGVLYVVASVILVNEKYYK